MTEQRHYEEYTEAPDTPLAEQIEREQEQATEEKKNVPPLETITYNDLMSKQFAELWQPIEGIVTEGLTVLCGGSKLGKSWICLDMAYCVATGTPFWGKTTHKSPVLYLALEDSYRRLNSRYVKMKSAIVLDQCTFEFAEKSQTMDDGVSDQIAAWIETHGGKHCMIMIDVLQKIRGKTRRDDGDAYQADYRNIGAIKAIADRFGAAVVIVHHTNKNGRSADRFDRISGSTGIMGVADTIIMITRERNAETAEVDITGREVYGDTFTIRLDAETMHWHAETVEDARRRAYESNEVVKTFRQLIKENPGGGRISYGDFRCRCLFFPYRDGKDLANKLNKGLAEDLRVYDGIIVTTGAQTYTTNGSHSKGIEYHKVSV